MNRGRDVVGRQSKRSGKHRLNSVVAKFRKAHLDISLEADHLRVIYYGKVEK